MAMLDKMLVAMGSEGDVQTIAERVGLPVNKVEEAIAALGVAHPQPGDAVTTASDSTGVPATKIDAILNQLGGREALPSLSSLLGLEDMDPLRSWSVLFG